MCLILFAYKIHPKYPLIVAANRDEFFHRPTKHAYFWEDHPNILAGRDLEKMGTWMGVTIQGRFSAITNYRDFKESLEGKQSRGHIVTNALQYDGNLYDYMNKLKEKNHLYPGYNLLAGDKDKLYYYSNRQGKVIEVEPGIHGLSNEFLNSPWPKVQTGKEGLKKILESEENLIENLFQLLQKSEPFPDEMLPNTGVPLDWERKLSPLFIQMPDYGTRASTIMLMGYEEITYVERTYHPVTKTTEEKSYHFPYWKLALN